MLCMHNATMSVVGALYTLIEQDVIWKGLEQCELCKVWSWARQPCVPSVSLAIFCLGGMAGKI